MPHLLFFVLAVLVVISMVPTILAEAPDIDTGSFTVPSWIKNNAGWWADGQIDDGSFVSSIQWLILNDVITISSTQQGAGDGENVIPNWVKNTAGWWAEDKIHDVTFVAAIKFLINQGIMIVGQVEQVEEAEECTFKGILVPCSDRKVVVEINDFYMEVNSGNCTTCVNWAHVGNNYNFQIETLDEKRGNYIDGVEINVKIISKGGELRHNFGQVTTEDGIYKNSITIPSLDWYAENLLFVTGEYYGIEKTIEKEFTVFRQIDGANPSTSNTAGSCSEVSAVSVATQEDNPQALAFSDDGRKLFVLGRTGDDVNEYTLASPYCLATKSFVDSFSVQSEDGQPHGLVFTDDGLKMFVVGKANDKIFQYSLADNFDVSTASFASKSCDVSSQDSDGPEGVTFTDDGLKMFVMGNQDNQAAIYQYSLADNFDVSTCSFANKSISIESRDNSPTDIAFTDDGLKMFVLGQQNKKVYQYSLTDNFDISTASFAKSFSVNTEDTLPRGMVFDPSGRYLFVIGAAGDDINVYKLSENFDISTAEVQSG